MFFHVFSDVVDKIGVALPNMFIPKPNVVLEECGWKWLEQALVLECSVLVSFSFWLKQLKNENKLLSLKVEVRLDAYVEVGVTSGLIIFGGTGLKKIQQF